KDGGAGGRIVLLAPRPGAGPHAEAATAGIENLARTLSIEWARHSITAVAVAPGARTPAGELAAVTAYLLSPAGAYFSGCLLDLRQSRVDEAERDRVDVDFELPPLLGDRFRQADHGGLAGGVVGLARVAERARGGGHVDDLAEHLPAFLALLLGGLAQVRRGR